MEAPPEVLGARQAQACRVSVDAREIVGGYVADEDVGHEGEDITR